MSTGRRVRLAGLAILIVGGIAAALIYASAAAGAAPDIPGLARSENSALERMGGLSLARTVAFDQWLASLWHGERLAWTVAGLAVVVGGACLYVAGLMEEPVEPDDRQLRGAGRDKR